MQCSASSLLSSLQTDYFQRCSVNWSKDSVKQAEDMSPLMVGEAFKTVTY